MLLVALTVVLATAAGALTLLIGRRMRLGRARLGGLIITVIIANTGSLGLPMTVVLLGSHALTHAVAYDQGIGTPMFFGPAFAIGAAFAVDPRAGERFDAGVGIPSAYLLEASMPSGANTLAIGHAFGLDQRLIATMIVWSTIIVLVVATIADLV